MIEKIYSIVVGSLLTALTFLFGEWTHVLTLLAVILFFEMATGLGKAFVNETVDSRIMFKGLIKKSAIFVVIVIAHFFDILMHTGIAFQTTVCLWYIGLEAVSVLENLSEMGVPVPKFVLDKFKQLQESQEEEGEDE